MVTDLALMSVLIAGILTTGAVLILRPISRQFGAFLEAATQAKLRPGADPELVRIREVLSSIDGRLDTLEERQDFAEALLSSADPKLLHVPTAVRAERN